MKSWVPGLSFSILGLLLLVSSHVPSLDELQPISGHVQAMHDDQSSETGDASFEIKLFEDSTTFEYTSLKPKYAEALSALAPCSGCRMEERSEVKIWVPTADYYAFIARV